MDPNETLKQLREHLNARDYDNGDGFDGTRELFIALDGWLTSGGFLPTDWTRAEGRNNSPMVVVTSTPMLDALANELKKARKLRVKIDGEQVKFKVNESMWSPPMGQIQEPY